MLRTKAPAIRPRALFGLLPCNFRRSLYKQSFVQGPTHQPLLNETLGSYFYGELLSKHGSKPALIAKKERPQAHGGPKLNNLGRADCLSWDFEDFGRHIDALARGLLHLGVKKGDRVAVVMGNNSAYATLQWACAKVGAILVTVNPAYRTHELIETLKLVGVHTLFLVPRIRTSTYFTSLCEELPALRSSKCGHISIQELPELRNIVMVDNSNDASEFRDLIDTSKCAVDFRDVLVWEDDMYTKKAMAEISETLDKDDIANLQFTSGTTGLPKAVSLTHHNLLNNAQFIGESMRITSSDVLCNVPPLFHCFGLVLGNLAAWFRAACIVYPSEIFDPVAVVDAINQERCSALHGVPTHFLGVLSEVEKREKAGETVDTSRLRRGIAAGSPIPIDLMKQLMEKLNLVELTNAFGMTETSPVSFQTTPDDSVVKRTETVGRVHPHAKAKLIDPDGNIVPVGTPGEICVSGYLVQKGYWNDTEQTNSVMKQHDGDSNTVWMHTGDIGILDEEGYLQVVGRIKDVVIRGGENLFPVQIENRLTFHPAIREAAVIAVPDPKYGEVVGVWVVREPETHQTREEVRAWVAKGMNPQNAPAWVWFVGEDGASALPKTASGKVMKHILRSWSKDLSAKGIGAVVSKISS